MPEELIFLFHVLTSQKLPYLTHLKLPGSCLCGIDLLPGYNIFQVALHKFMTIICNADFAMFKSTKPLNKKCKYQIQCVTAAKFEMKSLSFH